MAFDVFEILHNFTRSTVDGIQIVRRGNLRDGVRGSGRIEATSKELVQHASFAVVIGGGGVTVG